MMNIFNPHFLLYENSKIWSLIFGYACILNKWNGWIEQKDLNLANMFQWMIHHQTIGGLGELGLALQWLKLQWFVS